MPNEILHGALAPIRKTLMTRILSTLILFGLWGCSQLQPPKLFSPIEKIQILPYQDILTIQTDNFDTIVDLNSLLEIDNIWAIGSKSGIYLVDNFDKSVKKYFKFEIKSHFELFDGQDSIVGFNFVDFTTNKDKTKILVQTSNGIVFQLDLKTFNVDWLIKFVNRIETATYSENGKSIAIGTGYDSKKKVGRSITEYYSSLFLIESKTGRFIDHFNESASIKKILFKDNDSKLLVAYDWNYTDSYLWDINQKEQSIDQFREDDAFLYDILILEDSSFVTVNGNGLSKWAFNNPETKNLIYDNSNTGSERISINKLDSGYLLIAYTELTYFDNDFKIKDKHTFDMTFNEITYSKNDSIVILKNLMDKDDSREGYYYFNLKSKKIIQKVSIDTINKIIKGANTVYSK
jgi:hypothetical protein